jgi:hypothetical protein
MSQRAKQAEKQEIFATAYAGYIEEFGASNVPFTLDDIQFFFKYKRNLTTESVAATIRGASFRTDVSSKRAKAVEATRRGLQAIYERNQTQAAAMALSTAAAAAPAPAAVAGWDEEEEVQGPGSDVDIVALSQFVTPIRRRGIPRDMPQMIRVRRDLFRAPPTTFDDEEDLPEPSQRRRAVAAPRVRTDVFDTASDDDIPEPIQLRGYVMGLGTVEAFDKADEANLRMAIEASMRSFDEEKKRLEAEATAVKCCICEEPCVYDHSKCKMSYMCSHYLCTTCFLLNLKFEMEGGGGEAKLVHCPGCKGSSSSSSSSSSQIPTIIPESAMGLVDPALMVTNLTKLVEGLQSGMTLSTHNVNLEVAKRFQVLYFGFSMQLDPFIEYTVMDTAGVKRKKCTLCNTFSSSIGVDASTGKKVYRCPNIKCASLLCLDCGMPSHIGRDCETAKKELATEADRVSEELIAKSTKKCPKCAKRITHFKNHHCHHMTCTCGYQFCYCCLNQWGSGHSGQFGKYCPMFCKPDCSCSVCPICKPGSPCSDCDGCPACEPQKV